MKPREVQKRLEADGWRELPGGKTSHKQFKHPEKPGKVTVPFHPGDIRSYLTIDLKKIIEIAI